MTNGAATTNAFVIPHFVDTSNHLRRWDDLTDVPTTLRTGFVELEAGEVTYISGVEVLGSKVSASPQISIRSEYYAEALDLSAQGYELAEKAPFANQFKARKSGRFHSFQYVDPVQSQGALVRGLRVFYEVKSSR